MSRALYRGLSTPERIRPSLLQTQEADSPTRDRDEQGIEDRNRNRPVWEACFPHSIRLWIKQNLSFSSAHKHGLKSPESGSKSWKVSDSPGGVTRENSITGSTSPCGSNCFSCVSCNKKSSSGFPFLSILLLCILGGFVLITVVGLNRPYQKVVFPPHNYHRAQLFAWRDLLRGGILGRGSLISEPRELDVCPNGMEDYIPCYDITANRKAGYSDGQEFEQHCELTSKIQCLVPPPKDYRILFGWPYSNQGIWRGNLQIDEATIGNRFLIEEAQLKFPPQDQQLRNEVGSYVQEVAVALGLSAPSDFSSVKIRTVLDIGCGSGSLGGHLWGYEVLTLCIAPYEERGAQVQIALERGLPAMIGSLVVNQLPYPSSSFDLIHCAECGIKGNPQDGMSLLEVDRLLRAGGYFVWVKPVKGKYAMAKLSNLTSGLGWEMASASQHETLVIWQKKALAIDSKSKSVAPIKVCEHGKYDVDWAWHKPLRPCITVPPAHRQIPVHEQLMWPARLQLIDTEPLKSGPAHDEITGEPPTWSGTVADYWALLTPNIFSDHPKRLGDDDNGLNANLVRNMMDMNAGHGALNAALLTSGKQVWVMNVIPTSASNTLPFIYDRGLIGTIHDWCEPFPTYPRTYDFLHGADLLSQELKRRDSCGLANLFLEMDRVLRPEGWVFLRDEATLIEDARAVANQMRWESRIIEVLGDKDQRLLVCQKIFWKA
ncbi:unnamed protein product [Calypogeia fissa]